MALSYILVCITMISFCELTSASFLQLLIGQIKFKITKEFVNAQIAQDVQLSV